MTKNMQQMMKGLKAWWDGRTMAEREALAKRAGINVGSIRAAAEGNRRASADMGAAVEKAAEELGLSLRRGDVSKTCSECPYYRAKIEKESLV